MAEKKLAEIEAEVRRRWPVGDVALVHRLGRLDVGEVSVAVAVSCPHRAEAFDAVPVRHRRAQGTGPDLEEGERPGRHRRMGPPGGRSRRATLPPTVYLARHGETEWSKSGQHTGRTDIAADRRRARPTPRRSARGWPASPSPGCSAARCGGRSGPPSWPGSRRRSEPELLEWDYGEYEGLKTAEIRATPAGVGPVPRRRPGGESVGRSSDRVDRAGRQAEGADRERAGVRPRPRPAGAGGPVGRPAGRRSAGPCCSATATVSVLGFDHHAMDEPAIKLWNDDRHLRSAECGTWKWTDKTGGLNRLARAAETRRRRSDPLPHSALRTPHLLDSFGRVHNNLRISVTDRCNLRCTYCMPEDVMFLDRSRAAHVRGDRPLRPGRGRAGRRQGAADRRRAAHARGPARAGADAGRACPASATSG